LIENKFENIRGVLTKDGITIEGTNIFSSHYNPLDYNSVIQRRAKRFMNDIRGTNEIVFVRRDEQITLEQFKRFEKAILNINENCKFKFLIVSAIDKKDENLFIALKADNLTHTYIFKEDLPGGELWSNDAIIINRNGIERWREMMSPFNLKQQNHISLYTDRD
jgi:hypothetical protein